VIRNLPEKHTGSIVNLSVPHQVITQQFSDNYRLIH
jgi:hypothetical protein